MFDQVKEIADAYEILILTPQDVDSALSTEGTNLNWLEADASIKIIDKLNADKAILDAPSNNIPAYVDYVLSKQKGTTTIVAEHKADMNYPVVSAASILAKVTRDAEIEKIKKKIKINFGSGYPSDPLTQAFLKKHYKDYPEIFRKTWASYKKLVNGKNQSSLGDF